MWVLQALGDSDFGAVLRQLLPLVKPRGGKDNTSQGSKFREDECGPDELILLLVYLYSLADEAQPSAQDTEGEELEKLESELMGALTLVITQEQHLSPLLQKLTGERVSTKQFPDYYQEFAEFAGRGENETDEWLKLIVNFLCLPRAPLMGASLSKSSHLITLLLPLYSCSHTSTDKLSHILGSLARSCANKGVWENLSL